MARDSGRRGIIGVTGGASRRGPGRRIGGGYLSLGYAYTDARDRRNLFNSTAGSNYDQTAAFDRQNPDSSPGFYASKHNFTASASLREEFLQDLATSFGFTFVARSGRPYSLTFNGGGLFNDSSSGNNNALLYIPSGLDDPNLSPESNAAAVGELMDFARSLDCASEYRGRPITRNTCNNDWYYDLDLKISQELPGPGRIAGLGGLQDKITVYAMFDNFLNFLDSSWNVQRRRNFAGLQEVASLAICALSTACGTDAQSEAEAETWEGPPVTWARLADGSFGWSDHSAGFHGERCWKKADEYRCIQIIRFVPETDEVVDVDRYPTSFYGRRTRTLEKNKVYPEGGYSCRTIPSSSLGFRRANAEESISLGNGATIKNEIYSFDGNAWSEKYVEDFVAKNAPSDAAPVHFDCVALVAVLERANEQAFLTSVLTETDAFGQASPKS